MKTPYLDRIINDLEVIRSKGELTYRDGEMLTELKEVRQALEPKFTWEEFKGLLGDYKNYGYDLEYVAEKLGITFKEPEIELVEGEWYFVLDLGIWTYIKYQKEDGLDWSKFVVREKNNPPTE